MQNARTYESLQQKMKIEKIKRRNSFISNGKYENRQNCEQCGISNAQAIPKFAHFRNFDSFTNSKNSKIFKTFQFRKFPKFIIQKIYKISNL